MFDWFWEFLFSISQTIFYIIDGMMICANKLCGIDPIIVDGEEIDILSYFLFSDNVVFAFSVSALLATILLVIFSVFMILRTITKDKAEGTPAQIAIKAFKHLLMFFFVPAVIVAFIYLGNAFLKAIYSALIGGVSSIGSYLFASFAVKGGMDPETAELFRTGVLDYNDTLAVSEAMIKSNATIADYPSVFSLIAGLVILFGIGSAMFVFVDRVIAIVLLYIAAPISISSSVLDDGARFKLWRDQFLIKFLTAYGMILALNIYAMVCGLVMDPEFAFFDDPNADRIMKLLVIGGGAWSVQKAMALVGNLISQGAGSNELRDHTLTAGRLAGKVGGALATVTGVRAVKSILSDALSLKSRDLASKMVGGSGNDRDSGIRENSKAQNNQKPSYGSNPNASKDAINNSNDNSKSNKFEVSDWGGRKNGNSSGNGNGNQNTGKPNDNNKGMVNQAINNGNNNKKNNNSNDQNQREENK